MSNKLIYYYFLLFLFLSDLLPDGLLADEDDEYEDASKLVQSVEYSGTLNFVTKLNF